jgi:hypothetical protein
MLSSLKKLRDEGKNVIYDWSVITLLVLFYFARLVVLLNIA